MINKDGSYGPRATQHELAALYGEACVRHFEYLAEVHPDRWAFYVALVVEDAMFAANHGRRALRQSSLR